MLALWLATGLLAAQEVAPPVVVRRGDDGGIAYGSGTVEELFRDLALKQFADKLEEIREEVLEAEPEAIAEAVEAVSEIRALDIPQDLIARLDGISEALERMRFEADKTILAKTIADIESAQRLAEQKRARRRREEELILNFIARLV